MSYVGLSGGFGTVALGQVWSAANSHVGFLDNAPFLGDNELVGRTGNTVSYSASVGTVSFQIDAQGDQGMADKDIDSAGFGATVKIGDSGKIALGYTDYATMGKDTPKYAVPSKWTNADGEACVATDATDVLQCDYHPAVAASKDQDEHLDGDAQAVLAGQYTIGGVTMHLGYGERKKDTDSKAAVHATGNDWKAATHFGTAAASGGYARNGLRGGDLLDSKHKTTFFGFAGGLGDTGLSYNFQVRNKKNTENKVAHSYRDKLAAADNLNSDRTAVVDGDDDGSDTTAEIKAAREAGLRVLNNGNVGQVGQRINQAGDNFINPTSAATTADNARGTAKDTSKTTPWTVGLSRSLGGGATVSLEYANDDDDSTKNTTALMLQVVF